MVPNAALRIMGGVVYGNFTGDGLGFSPVLFCSHFQTHRHCLLVVLV